MKIDVDFDDIREGDFVTLAYEGHEFSGLVWESWNGILWVGDSILELYDPNPGFAIEGYKFVSATCEENLPTGIGAVVEINERLYINLGPSGWWNPYDETNYDLEGLVKHYKVTVLSKGVEIE